MNSGTAWPEASLREFQRSFVLAFPYLCYAGKESFIKQIIHLLIRGQSF